MQRSSYSFFEHGGTEFRRRNNGLTRGVDDVLRGGAWVPYVGADTLEPALFGDEIDDPLAIDHAAARAHLRLVQ